LDGRVGWPAGSLVRAPLSASIVPQLVAATEVIVKSFAEAKKARRWQSQKS